MVPSMRCTNKKKICGIFSELDKHAYNAYLNKYFITRFIQSHLSKPV